MSHLDFIEHLAKFPAPVKIAIFSFQFHHNVCLKIDLKTRLTQPELGNDRIAYHYMPPYIIKTKFHFL